MSASSIVRCAWIHVRGLTGAFGSTLGCCVAVLLALASAAFLVLQGPQPSDDAFITFRHVRNLLEYGRASWNFTGPPVLGSTSPAYMLALTAWCGLTGIHEVDRAALYLNAILHGVIVLLAYLTAWDTVAIKLPAILAAAIVGVNATNIYVFSQGFENAMLTAALLGAACFARRKLDTTAVTMASLLPLIRPEGILGTFLVWGYVAATRRLRLSLLPWMVFIPSTWFAFSSVYYGSPIPQPLHAIKKFPSVYEPYSGGEVDLVVNAIELPRRLFAVPDHQAVHLLVHGQTDQDHSWIGCARSLVVIAGILLLSAAACVRWSASYIILIYPALFLLFFSWLGHARYWYFPSFVTISTIGAICGFGKAAQWWDERCAARRSASSIHWLANSILLLPCLWSLSANRYTQNSGDYGAESKGRIYAAHPAGWHWDLLEQQRYHHYRSAAEWLNLRIHATDRALISEVGLFGYYFVGEVIDAVGLCSPEALSFYPPAHADLFRPDGSRHNQANNVVPLGMVMTLRPEFVVNSRYFIANLLQDGSPFLSEYELVAEFGRVFGEPVMVFRRIVNVPAAVRDAESPASLAG